MRLSEVSVGPLLRTLGLPPQRPLDRAWQQNPEAVRRWKAEEYPQIREHAAEVGATIWFADAAGGAPTTTRAPPGRRSGRPRWFRPPRPGCGQLDLGGHRQGRAAVCRLPRHAHRPGVHRLLPPAACRHAGAAVLHCRWPSGAPLGRRQGVRRHRGAAAPVFLPGYSPELNPGEWVWKNIKRDPIGRTGIDSLADLKGKALAALHRLQKLPHVIRGFFQDPKLRYITE
jgi:hypothetical protein